MNIAWVSLLVIHISAAAAWVGGSTMLEIVLNPKISSISAIQAGPVSKRIEDIFTITAWAALTTMAATGIVLSIMQGSFNLSFLLNPTGMFLLASMILTAIALVNGALISYYFAPRLKLIKMADSKLRDLVKVAIRGNNLIGLVVVTLMVIFTELVILK